MRSLPEMACELDDIHLEANINLQIAVALRNLGFAKRAKAATQKSLRQARKIGFRRNEAIAHEYLGDCYLDLGNHRTALTHYKDALKIGLETAPEGDVVCEAYRRLAEVYYARGEFGRAEKAITEGWRICDHLQDDYERVGLLRVKGGLALEREDYDESDRHFRTAVSICAKRGFRLEEAVTLEYIGFAHQTSGRLETAERYLHDAIQLYDELRLTRLALRLLKGRRALSRKRPAKRASRDPLHDARRWERFGIRTRSRALLNVLDQVERVAETRLPVLIAGESGVGKELVAHSLHALSRRPGSMVDINCPAIPETMLESELFGSRKGAFTGAEDRPGLVAGADGGTLFLDEIGDMPQKLQVKLLRFLESSSYRSVGGRSKSTVDVRVISATNSALEEKVASGRFRRDLFHRIAGVLIEIPPLRNRPEDIDLLADYFLSRLFAESAGRPPVIDKAVMKHFHDYGWPGNVRELQHVIEGTAFNLGNRRRMTLETLPPRLRTVAPTLKAAALDAERITQEVAYHDGSVTGAAEALGVSRQHLYRRMKEIGLDPRVLRKR